MIALGKALAIDGERRAGRHAAGFGRPHHERAEAPHLLLQQADGVVELVAAKRVAAHEFGEPIGLVDGGRPRRPHLVQSDGHAARRHLPGGLEPAKPAADDPDGISVARLRAGRLRLAPFDAFALIAAVGFHLRLRLRLGFRLGRVGPGLPALRTGGDLRGAPPARPTPLPWRSRQRRARFEQRTRLLERQRGRIDALGDRRVHLAVGHVRTVAALEHLERRAAVGHLNLPDDPLRSLTRRSAWGRPAARARARDRW